MFSNWKALSTTTIITWLLMHHYLNGWCANVTKNMCCTDSCGISLKMLLTNSNNYSKLFKLYTWPIFLLLPLNPGIPLWSRCHNTNFSQFSQWLVSISLTLLPLAPTLCCLYLPFPDLSSHDPSILMLVFTFYHPHLFSMLQSLLAHFFVYVLPTVVCAPPPFISGVFDLNIFL